MITREQAEKIIAEGEFDHSTHQNMDLVLIESAKLAEILGEEYSNENTWAFAELMESDYYDIWYNTTRSGNTKLIRGELDKIAGREAKA